MMKPTKLTRLKV